MSRVRKSVRSSAKQATQCKAKSDATQCDAMRSKVFACPQSSAGKAKQHKVHMSAAEQSNTQQSTAKPSHASKTAMQEQHGKMQRGQHLCQQKPGNWFTKPSKANQTKRSKQRKATTCPRSSAVPATPRNAPQLKVKRREAVTCQQGKAGKPKHGKAKRWKPMLPHVSKAKRANQSNAAQSKAPQEQQRNATRAKPWEVKRATG